MQHTPNEPKGNCARSAVLRLIEANRALLASIEALAVAVTEIGSETDTTAPISEAEAIHVYGLNRHYLRKRGLRFTRGPKKQRFYDRREIAALFEASREESTGPAPAPANDAAPADPLDRLLASGKLKRAGRRG